MSKNSPLDDMTKSVVEIEENKTKTFADNRLAYGITWAREIKGNVEAFPTPEEMLVGLYKWLCN